MYEIRSGEKRVYIDTDGERITLQVFNKYDNSQVTVDLDAYRANDLAHRLIDQAMFLKRRQDV